VVVVTGLEEEFWWGGLRFRSESGVGEVFGCDAKRGEGGKNGLQGFKMSSPGSGPCRLVGTNAPPQSKRNGLALYCTVPSSARRQVTSASVVTGGKQALYRYGLSVIPG
jgi:hypothetical protein